MFLSEWVTHQQKLNINSQTWTWIMWIFYNDFNCCNNMLLKITIYLRIKFLRPRLGRSCRCINLQGHGYESVVDRVSFWWQARLSSSFIGFADKQFRGKIVKVLDWNFLWVVNNFQIEKIPSLKSHKIPLYRLKPLKSLHTLSNPLKCLKIPQNPLRYPKIPLKSCEIPYNPHNLWKSLHVP